MKVRLCAYGGACLSFISSLFGGWDNSLTTLIVLMAIDYATGLLIPIIYGNSPKSKNGGLSSEVSFKGICKKIMILIFVFIGHRMDILLQITYVRDFVAISFIINELISISENAKIMNVPMPKVLFKAIDILNDKLGGKDNDR